MEGSEKDQVAGLELTESFLLCGRAVMRTHIKNMVIFFHSMSGKQVASGKFSTATGEAEVTRLEYEVSFLQVKATMSLKERICHLKLRRSTDPQTTQDPQDPQIHVPGSPVTFR